MNQAPDLLIVGAGPTGCVIARQAARKHGWRSIVIDRRSHVAGLCHDCLHPSGVLVHAFGPHFFRTNSFALVQYLSEFTDWIEGKYIVRSKVGDQLFPFPINLTTLEMVFERDLDEQSARALLDSISEPHPNPENAEQWVCSRVGRRIYEMFYRGYTIKQWGVDPSKLDKSICGRIPIRFNREERYVDHTFQLTPRDGFTAMFENMLDHPLIETRLDSEYLEAKAGISPRLATVYCGAVDEYFNYGLGRLPWRSLRFEFLHYDKEFVQPCVQINYPNEHDFTRSVEIKHITGQRHPGTVVCYEYPKAAGEPYYPVLSPQSSQLYDAYRQLADLEAERHGVYIAGRLGRFCYINSDEAMERAFGVFEEISRRFG